MSRFRPLSPAWRGVAVTFVALGLAALLNAHGLQKTATIQSEGARRDVAVAVTRHLVRVSDALRLSEPRKALKQTLGREWDDVVDTTIGLPLPVGTQPLPSERPPQDRQVPRAGVSESRPRAAAPRSAFSPQRPLRVWVGGDSLIKIPGVAFERSVPRGGAIQIAGIESRLASGLGRPDVFNWYRRFREVIKEEQPDVVVLSFGSNDGHNYLSGVPKGVTVGPLGSPTWIREYRRRTQGVTTEFRSSGAYVIWVGLPKTQSEKRNQSFRVVNSVLRATAASNGAASTYVDTWRMFTNRYRSYVEYMRDSNGKLVRMRGADGVHYEPAAGDVLARHLLAHLEERYDLSSWRQK